MLCNFLQVLFLTIHMFLSFNYVDKCGGTLSYFYNFPITLIYHIQFLISLLIYIQVVFNFCYNQCCNRHPCTYLFIYIRKVSPGYIRHVIDTFKDIFIKHWCLLLVLFNNVTVSFCSISPNLMAYYLRDVFFALAHYVSAASLSYVCASLWDPG